MVNEVAECYNPALAREIKSTTQRINDIAKTHGVYHATNYLVTTIAGPRNEEAGRELIDHYQSADYSTAILERRGPTSEDVQHTPRDPLSVRATIERAIAAEQPVDDRPVAHRFADILERVTDRQEQIAAEPEAFALRDHISNAFDREVTGEQADNLESSLDLLDGMQPEMRNERYQEE